MGYHDKALINVLQKIFWKNFGWVEGEVYDWLMFLRKKEWFTVERGVELSFCMVAVAEELGLILDYDILRRSWE